MRDKEAKNYANLLIEKLEETQEGFEGEGLIPPVFDIWKKLIRAKCRERLKEYQNEEADTYKLSDTEMSELYEKAKGDYIDEALLALTERGLLEISVGEDGEFRYGLSDKGRDLADIIKNFPNDDSDDE